METFNTYADMRQKIGELYQQGEYAQAAEILAWGLKQYPDHMLANAYNLAACQAMLGQAEEAVESLLYGLDHGIWYGQWDFGFEMWDALKVLPAFQTVVARSMERQQEAHKTSRPELTIVPPAGYDPARKYPLFIALHGGNETAAGFQELWTSPRLVDEFIVAYPQSSRPVSMRGFSWIGDDLDRQEVHAAYQAVLKDYSVDTESVLVGGFSSGGNLTLSMLLDEQQILPVRGFIVLCPPAPGAYPPEAVARIRRRGQKGLILTTEMDDRLEEQRKLAQAFEAGGVECQFIVTPDVGHWYPPDFAQRVDAAIGDILGP